MNSEDKKIINTIKVLGLDLIDNAKSGHPGIVLGAAPIIYTLYANHLNIDPKNPLWLNRDRFILSAGHGSALLYSTLFLAGYNIDLEELRNFRKLNSKTPGHPEYRVTDGVDMTTGLLGQGFASAVGVAMAERYIGSKVNSSGKLIDYNTYVLCSDGDLMEGITTEAASLAGTLKLGKLIVLYDSNNMSLDGPTNITFTENVTAKFKALGWHTQIVKNGEDVNAIDKAIKIAKKAVNQPSIIEIKTIIGKGSLHQNTAAIHGKLESEDCTQLKQKLNAREIPFAVSKEGMDMFQAQISKRCEKSIKDFNDAYNELEEGIKNLIGGLIRNDVTINLSNMYNDFTNEQGRITSGKVLNIIAENTTFFLGGSADLSSSTMTHLNSYGDYSSPTYSEKNINFGVREHAMGAILNGLAVSNLRPFGSTFLVFADYMKPAIRLSAMMNLPVIYVFTHDSIAIGSDGPTHQPIEQLAMLRSIPNVDVYRPADGREIVGAYNEALQKKDGPSVIVIARGELRRLDNSSSNLSHGGYVIRQEKQKLDGIIVATGKEVDTALLTAENLALKNIDLRVVSMPNLKLFFKQTGKYIDEVLPPNVKIIVIEAASSYGWHQLTSSKNLITIDTFGKCGTEAEVCTEFKFDLNSIIAKVEKILK